MHNTDVCYVCGYNGMTEIAHTRPNPSSESNQSSTSKLPCFPSLLLIPPAASSKPPSPVDGHVRLCLLCYRFLMEQWKSYEKRKTPLANRQYWLKCCSAIRDGFDLGNAARPNANRSSTSGADLMVESSRSPSPNATSGNGRDGIFGRSMLATTTDAPSLSRGQESRRSRAAAATTTDRKPPGAAANTKLGSHSPDAANRSICVVCSRGVESMDVCRRLPAHLVAQIADVKPNLAQVPGQQFSAASLTGEVLVCDECFASSSFQAAWLDCCRRGNVPTLPTQSSASSQRQQAEASASSNEGVAATIQAMMNSAPSQNLTESQRQWFALYERALLQFHFTGQLDPMMVGQLQQLAAAEALASLQHAGGRESIEGSNNDQSENTA